MRWQWAGHAAELNDNRWIHKLTFWYLKQEKRKPGKQNIRWMDELINFTTKCGTEFLKVDGSGADYRRPLFKTRAYNTNVNIIEG